MTVFESNGETWGLGTIANREDSVRRFIKNLGPPDNCVLAMERDEQDLYYIRS